MTEDVEKGGLEKEALEKDELLKNDKLGDKKPETNKEQFIQENRYEITLGVNNVQ